MSGGMPSLSPTRRGAWLINASRHLTRVSSTHPGLVDFENTMAAGQCGSLLVRLSGDVPEDSLSAKRVEALARACGLNRATTKEHLNVLRSMGAVDWNDDATEYRVLACSRDRALRTAAEIFRLAVPQGKDARLPELLEFCLQRPRFAEEIKAVFAPTIPEGDIDHLLDLVANFRVLGRRMVGGKRLYFNAYQFGDNAEKIGRALQAFNAAERGELDDLLGEVRLRPGLPSSSLRVSDKVVKMAVGLGLVETNSVNSPAGTAEFFTAPLLAPPSVGKETGHLEDDVFHHAKILLASLRYGETYSTPGRGRIIDPGWIVGGLLSRDEVGPCTAIGEDYVLLEKEGVIRTNRALDRPGKQYAMSLRRREPAEMVLSLLEAGNTARIDARVLPASLRLPTGYTSPDVTRSAAMQEAFEIDPRTSQTFLEALRS